VPEFPIDPAHPGDEAVGLDGAKNGACLGINLIDLSIPILSDPESTFGPRAARVAATARRRDRREHPATLRIDLLNAIFGDLKQVLAVEGGSCMRSDINRAQHLPAGWVEGVQLVPGSKPDVLAVIRDTMDSVGTWKRTILTNDFRV